MINTKNILATMAVLLLSLATANVAPSVVNAADNPMPAVTSLSPSTLTVGGSGFTLNVNGNNFIPGSVVYFNGSPLSTTYVSPTQLTASVPSTNIGVAGN